MRSLRVVNGSFDRLLEDFWNGIEAPRAGFTPPVDLSETSEHYLINIDVPGMAQEDLSVEFEDRVLVVSGERKPEVSGNEYYRSERSFGSFERSFKLPEGADPEKITAEFENGVLRIAVGKKPTAQKQKIEIGSSSGFFQKLLSKKEEIN